MVLLISESIIKEGYREVHELNMMATEIIEHFTLHNISFVDHVIKFGFQPIYFKHDIDSLFNCIKNSTHYELLGNFIRKDHMTIEFSENIKDIFNATYHAGKITINISHPDFKDVLIAFINKIKNNVTNIKIYDKKFILHNALNVYKTSIIHELQHAYDDYRSQGKYISDKKSNKYYGKRKYNPYDDEKMDPETYKEYLGLPHEYWARFSQTANDIYWGSSEIPFQKVAKQFKTSFLGWDLLPSKTQERLYSALYKYYELKKATVTKH